MPSSRTAKILRLFALAAVVHAGNVVFHTKPVFAQSYSSEYKTNEVSAFGTISYVEPGYVQKTGYGTSFGLDATHFWRFPVAPSLEARANMFSGSEVNEKSYLVGLRGQAMLFRRLRPYGDFLIGLGTIHFNHPVGGYLGDKSGIKNFGGGVDMDVTRTLQVKLDGQYQIWQIDPRSTFHPWIVGVGVNYRIPFRPRIRQTDFVR